MYGDVHFILTTGILEDRDWAVVFLTAEKLKHLVYNPWAITILPVHFFDDKLNLSNNMESLMIKVLHIFRKNIVGKSSSYFIFYLMNLLKSVGIKIICGLESVDIEYNNIYFDRN